MRRMIEENISMKHGAITVPEMDAVEPLGEEAPLREQAWNPIPHQYVTSQTAEAVIDPQGEVPHKEISPEQHAKLVAGVHGIERNQRFMLILQALLLGVGIEILVGIAIILGHILH